MPRTSMLESLLHSAASTRPATSAGLPPPPPGTALAAGASHLVEAATTEDALADVSAMLGPDARIVDARRVRRGGIGGFFAKEVVQLHAASARAGGSSERRPGGGQASADGGRDARRSAPSTGESLAELAAADRSPGTGVDAPLRDASPVHRLLADLDDAPDDVDFATYLRGQLAADASTAPRGDASTDVQNRADGASSLPTTATPQTAPTWPTQSIRPAGAVTSPIGNLRAEARAADPAPWTPPRVEPTTEDTSRSGWSREALLRVGLPAELVRRLEVADPSDDLSWTAALTDGLRSNCRPLPIGASVVIGPRAADSGLADTVADAVLARSPAFLAAMRRDRWVHLVVGGEGWRDGLAADPAVVSWARDEDLPEAIRCAVEFGLVLGYGPGRDGLARAQPFDIALVVRDAVVGS